jgi:hypothetical protein
MSRSYLMSVAAVVGSLVAYQFVSADTLTFGVQNRANGVDWNTSHSEANVSSRLMLGQDSAEFNGADNKYGKTSAQLRFDVTSLNGLYGSIDSATITLTQQAQRTGCGTCTLGAYLIADANSGWTNSGTWGTIDGVNAWAGGSTGCTAAGTDYTGSAVGSVGLNAAAAVGTTYSLTITGAAARQAIASWASGGTNAGFLLYSDWENQSVDSRCLLNTDATLTVDYTAAVPEPASITLLTTCLFGLLAYAWRKCR